jgi:NTP pyrophosphatase (non-canonical NTP hydrolase)
MNKSDFNEAVERSLKIRERYHELELQHHGSKWTVEEDALAFLTDAGLVGRLTMSQQGRWPAGKDANEELEHKLGESIWWLVVLAKRMDIDIQEVLNQFLTKTEKLLGK